MLDDRTELTVMNAINVLLAVILFVSPWLLGFRTEPMASWNAWICGVLIAVLAVAALSDLREWEEWSSAVLGLWTILAPWILGFAAIAAAKWTHVIVGLAVAIVAGIEAWLLHGNPPAHAA